MDLPSPRAERVARLAARDRLMALLGIAHVDGGPGRAAVALAIRDDHLNFNGTCHGGVTFALADSAFGLASNSHGAIAAAIDAHITYQVAVRAGDVLTATAVEVSRSRRLGVYRIDVTRQDGAIVSTFTGTVYDTGRPNEP
jgi:acyl-CoA thioesterase